MLSSVINNRLNNVMKILTSITIVMAIPTIISGIYGMNVDGRWMPLSTTPYGFYIIVGMYRCALVFKEEKNDVKIYRNIISIFYVRFIQ